MVYRILISGLGSIGERHLKNLQSMGVGECATFDPCSAEGKYKSFEDALCTFKPDIVFVCSPTSFHISQAKLAMEHGAHVFIEKPLSHSMNGIDGIERTSSRKNLITMVGCNMRFHPGPKKIKELLSEGCIGTPISARLQTGSYLPRWRPGSDYHKSYSATPKEGGAILDCIHEIDLALWYFGPATLLHAVCTPAQSIGLSVEGLAEILLQHSSGTLTSLHLNFIQRDERRFCQIFGTKGSLYWDMERQTVDHYGEDGKCKASWSVEGKQFTLNDMYIDEVRHLLDCVHEEKQTCCPISNARESLQIALAARQNFPPPRGEGQGEGVKKFHIAV